MKNCLDHGLYGFRDDMDINSIEFEGISPDTKMVKFDHFEPLTNQKRKLRKSVTSVSSNKSVILTI